MFESHSNMGELMACQNCIFLEALLKEERRRLGQKTKFVEALKRLVFKNHNNFINGTRESLAEYQVESARKNDVLRQRMDQIIQDYNNTCEELYSHKNQFDNLKETIRNLKTKIIDVQSLNENLSLENIKLKNEMSQIKDNAKNVSRKKLSKERNANKSTAIDLKAVSVDSNAKNTSHSGCSSNDNVVKSFINSSPNSSTVFKVKEIPLNISPSLESEEESDDGDLSNVDGICDNINDSQIRIDIFTENSSPPSNKDKAGIDIFTENSSPPSNKDKEVKECRIVGNIESNEDCVNKDNAVTINTLEEFSMCESLLFDPDIIDEDFDEFLEVEPFAQSVEENVESTAVILASSKINENCNSPLEKVSLDSCSTRSEKDDIAIEETIENPDIRNHSGSTSPKIQEDESNNLPTIVGNTVNIDALPDIDVLCTEVKTTSHKDNPLLPGLANNVHHGDIPSPSKEAIPSKDSVTSSVVSIDTKVPNFPSDNDATQKCKTQSSLDLPSECTEEKTNPEKSTVPNEDETSDSESDRTPLAVINLSLIENSSQKIKQNRSADKIDAGLSMVSNDEDSDYLKYNLHQEYFRFPLLSPLPTSPKVIAQSNNLLPEPTYSSQVERKVKKCLDEDSFNSIQGRAKLNEKSERLLEETDLDDDNSENDDSDKKSSHILLQHSSSSVEEITMDNELGENVQEVQLDPKGSEISTIIEKGSKEIVEPTQQSLFGESQENSNTIDGAIQNDSTYPISEVTPTDNLLLERRMSDNEKQKSVIFPETESPLSPIEEGTFPPEHTQDSETTQDLISESRENSNTIVSDIQNDNANPISEVIFISKMPLEKRLSDIEKQKSVIFPETESPLSPMEEGTFPPEHIQDSETTQDSIGESQENLNTIVGATQNVNANLINEVTFTDNLPLEKRIADSEKQKSVIFPEIESPLSPMEEGTLPPEHIQDSEEEQCCTSNKEKGNDFSLENQQEENVCFTGATQSPSNTEKCLNDFPSPTEQSNNESCGENVLKVTGNSSEGEISKEMNSISKGGIPEEKYVTNNEGGSHPTTYVFPDARGPELVPNEVKSGSDSTENCCEKRSNENVQERATSSINKPTENSIFDLEEESSVTVINISRTNMEEDSNSICEPIYDPSKEKMNGNVLPMVNTSERKSIFDSGKERSCTGTLFLDDKKSGCAKNGKNFCQIQPSPSPCEGENVLDISNLCIVSGGKSTVDNEERRSEPDAGCVAEGPNIPFDIGELSSSISETSQCAAVCDLNLQKAANSKSQKNANQQNIIHSNDSKLERNKGFYNNCERRVEKVFKTYRLLPPLISPLPPSPMLKHVTEIGSTMKSQRKLQDPSDNPPVVKKLAKSCMSVAEQTTGENTGNSPNKIKTFSKTVPEDNISNESNEKCTISSDSTQKTSSQIGVNFLGSVIKCLLTLQEKLQMSTFPESGKEDILKCMNETFMEIKQFPNFNNSDQSPIIFQSHKEEKSEFKSEQEDCKTQNACIYQGMELPPDENLTHISSKDFTPNEWESNSKKNQENINQENVDKSLPPDISILQQESIQSIEIENTKTDLQGELISSTDNSFDDIVDHIKNEPENKSETGSPDIVTTIITSNLEEDTSEEHSQAGARNNNSEFETESLLSSNDASCKDSSQLASSIQEESLNDITHLEIIGTNNEKNEIPGKLCEKESIIEKCESIELNKKMCCKASNKELEDSLIIIQKSKNFSSINTQHKVSEDNIGIREKPTKKLKEKSKFKLCKKIALAKYQVLQKPSQINLKETNSDIPHVSKVLAIKGHDSSPNNVSKKKLEREIQEGSVESDSNVKKADEYLETEAIIKEMTWLNSINIVTDIFPCPSTKEICWKTIQKPDASLVPSELSITKNCSSQLTQEENLDDHCKYATGSANTPDSEVLHNQAESNQDSNNKTDIDVSPESGHLPSTQELKGNINHNVKNFNSESVNSHLVERKIFDDDQETTEIIKENTTINSSSIIETYEIDSTETSTNTNYIPICRNVKSNKLVACYKNKRKKMNNITCEKNGEIIDETLNQEKTQLVEDSPSAEEQLNFQMETNQGSTNQQIVDSFKIKQNQNLTSLFPNETVCNIVTNEPVTSAPITSYVPLQNSFETNNSNTNIQEELSGSNDKLMNKSNDTLSQSLSSFVDTTVLEVGNMEKTQELLSSKTVNSESPTEVQAGKSGLFEENRNSFEDNIKPHSETTQSVNIGFYKEITAEEEQEKINRKRKMSVDGTNEKKELEPISKKSKVIEESEILLCEENVFKYTLDYCCDIFLKSVAKKKKNKENKLSVAKSKTLETAVMNFLSAPEHELQETFKNTIQVADNVDSEVIADLLVDIVFEDLTQTDLTYTPPAPPLTVYQQRLLTLVVMLSRNKKGYVANVLGTFEELILPLSDGPIALPKACSIVRFHTAFCKHLGYLQRSRTFMFDILYSRGMKAFPMIFTMLTSWPEILPNSDESKDCILTNTIVFVLLNPSTPTVLKEIYLPAVMRQFLEDIYGYKETLTKDQQCTKIVQSFEKKGSTSALVLLCKRSGWQWALKKMETLIVPILDNWFKGGVDDNTVSQAILCLGQVLRGMPTGHVSSVVRKTLEILLKVLNKQNNLVIAEAAVEAISLLRRHDLFTCASVLKDWSPQNKTVTKKIVADIRTVLSVKPINYWNSFLSR